jgi:hypothetical protein
MAVHDLDVHPDEREEAILKRTTAREYDHAEREAEVLRSDTKITSIQSKIYKHRRNLVEQFGTKDNKAFYDCIMREMHGGPLAIQAAKLYLELFFGRDPQAIVNFIQINESVGLPLQNRTEGIIEARVKSKADALTQEEVDHRLEVIAESRGYKLVKKEDAP